jgi:serine/threonine protein kinase
MQGPGKKSSSREAVPERIGSFTVIRPLGHGGMASAHLARAPDGTLVVLKKALRNDSTLEAHIIDEARVGSRLRHPSLVDTRGLITDDDGAPVLVVDYIPGVPLDVLIRSGKVRTPVVLRIARQIASALGALHSATDEDGVSFAMVHRDVSPSNIILGLDGDARLIDLGIVRFRGKQASKTEQGFLRGKVKYLAPELFKTSVYSPQSDLWALGVVVLELALGRSALRGGRAESIARILDGRLLELDQGEALDPRLHEVLRKLLAVDPAERFLDAREAEALLARLEGSFGDTRTLACLSLPAIPLDQAALSTRATWTPPEVQPAAYVTPDDEDPLDLDAEAFEELPPTYVEPRSGPIPIVHGVEATPWATATLVPTSSADDAARGFEDSGEITVDLPHLEGRRRRAARRDESGLATVVRSWVVDPGLDPREQIKRYIDVLRGFEALPFVT